MDVPIDKIVVPARAFAGGTGGGVFQAHERLGPGPGLRVGQRSTTRNVVSVAGGGQTGRAIRAEFDLPPRCVSSASQVCEHHLRIRGMWDHARYLEARFARLHGVMPTFGRFRIAINSQPVFDDQVFYWNYRQWRFWPCLEIPVSSSAFRQGTNELVFENLTGPFPANIPEWYRHDFLDSDPAAVPFEIAENTTFNVSDIQILTRRYRDLDILNSPRVVRVGEPFLIEVFGTREHELTFDRHGQVDVLCGNGLRLGRNKLFFRITAPGTQIDVRAKSTSTGRSFAARIASAVAVASPPSFWLGHIIGGHRSAIPVNHNYTTAVERFRDAGQGNLVAWLASPGKAGDYITRETLPIDDVRESGLKVLFRYYGQFPTGCDYPNEIARCIEALGNSFLGLAPHERGGAMPSAMQRQATRNEAVALFSKETHEMLSDVKALAGDHLVWITDPSLYANIYRRAGADRVGLEMFPLHCNLNIASVRGTGRMYGDREWAAINSFECQAYGGLDMLEPMTDLDRDYDAKRARLWRISQYHLYLAGARIIYSESGAFDHVVTRHLEMDDPRSVAFRRTQKELYEFSKVQARSDYRGLIFVGDHTLTEQTIDQLDRYVRDGGHIVVNLVDFLDDTAQPPANDALSRLCGVTVGAEVEKQFLWQLDVCDPDFEKDFAPLVTPCLRGRGAYDGLVLGSVEPTPAANVVLRDAFTQCPVLIRHALGKGQVWLVNAVHHHANREYQRLANRIVETVLRRIPRSLTLQKGPCINYFVYPHGPAENAFKQVFVLNNDWFSLNTAHTATFKYNDMIFSLRVRPGRVAQFFLIGDIVLVSDSPWLRCDGFTTHDRGAIDVRVQGTGPTRLDIHTPRPIACVELSEPVGPQPLDTTRRAGKTTVRTKLTGPHTVRIRCERV